MVFTLLAIRACFSTLWRFLNDLWIDICFIYKLIVFAKIYFTSTVVRTQWVININSKKKMSVLECTKLHKTSHHPTLTVFRVDLTESGPLGQKRSLLKNPLVLGLRNWDSHYQWLISNVRENLRWGFFLGYWPQLVFCCWCYFRWFCSSWRGGRLPCHTSLTLFIQFSRWGTWDQPL